jgi:hypothetical protein
MIEHKKIKNNLFIAIGLIMMLGVLYFYLFNIVAGKRDGELYSSISKLREFESAQANFSTYDKFLRDTNTERLKLDALVVEKNTLAGFIEEIEMLAKHANVEITKSLSVEKNPQKPKESMIRFNIRSKGKFSDAYYFSLLVENLPYKIRIKKMALATSGSAPQEIWTGEINFELLSYINE